MKKKISKKIKWGKILPVLSIFLGIVLMIYMIKVEDEPGALPLLLIIAGTIWLIINRYQTKRQIQ
ncbi:PEP-CTERM protein-sorting domain-containing protein [Parafilimonas terrae]|jgi:hypothetical protein|uniref:PEP-CTERM protein-sorting domain-containing protein n=1 Tax=Parafilimonas terrae TaxID=1465490 RepID=A0A1I5S615_9BACT|nr:PEP-CTERM protein-sorting domain-containing protein [Parafilimonas terrae]